MIIDRFRKRDVLDPLLAGAGLAGAAMMLYLTYLHYSGGDSSVCDFSAGFSCQIVNQSVYAEILGVPVAILGLLYFSGVAGLASRKDVPRRHTYILLFTIFSLVFGLYLSTIEFFVLGSVCLFCELSKGVMLFILGVSLSAVRKRGDAVPASWFAAAVAVGLLFAAGHYVLQREPPPQYDFTPVAQCLTENGVSMYGSFTCPKCAKQKRLFGDAFSSVSYVECHPQGPNPQTERCVGRDVTVVPMWIQDKDGVELKRLQGVHSVEGLAAYFGCPL